MKQRSIILKKMLSGIEIKNLKKLTKTHSLEYLRPHPDVYCI